MLVLKKGMFVCLFRVWLIVFLLEFDMFMIIMIGYILLLCCFCNFYGRFYYYRGWKMYGKSIVFVFGVV